MKRAIQLVLTGTLALSLSGCLLKKKSSNQPSTVSEPKNRGQARKQEVHERNEERKDAKNK